MKNILLAGSTGYLGGFILKELLYRGFETRIIVRNEKKLPLHVTGDPRLELVRAQVTEPQSLKTAVVISIRLYQPSGLPGKRTG